MNKFILIPKDRYDKFKEVQDNKDTNLPKSNHTTENKIADNLSDDSFKVNNTRQMKALVKPEESENRELPPPPGLPEQYINSFDVNSHSQIPNTPGDANGRDSKQVGYGATGKGIRRRPEWTKFWNKNIRTICNERSVPKYHR